MWDSLTVLFSQAELDKVQDAFQLFRWALTATGLGVLLIGIVMYYYRPKDESKRSTHSARLTALISFAVIGFVTIVYAWTWFGR